MLKTTIKNPDLVRKRQKQICDGAMKIFRKKSFHATTMREIAKASGIGLGSLYDYINKKEDILSLSQTNFITEIDEHYSEILDKYKSPVEQLIHLVKELVRHSFRRKEDVLLIYRETKSLEREALQKLLQNESLVVSRVEAVIKEGVRQGVFQCRHPKIYANIILFNMALLPLRDWNILRSNDVEEVLEELLDLFLKGLELKASCPVESNSENIEGKF